MNQKRLLLCLAGTILLPAQFGFGQTYYPPQQTYTPQQTYAPPRAVVPAQPTAGFNTVPANNTVQPYNSVPNYNGVQPYNTVQPYNSVPAANSIANSKPAWYQKLTDKREFDFGTVARASKQVHVFEFENNTGDDLLLSHVRASCGCTKPKILTQQVKPGETAKLEALFDTLNFYGARGATLTVSLQKTGKYTEFAELQFAVKGKIRRDVVLNPGEIKFDEKSVAENQERTARIMYAGNANWKILEVKSTSPSFTASAKEIERNPATGRVTYDLVVKPNAEQSVASGNEYLTIVTNDPKTNGMPVLIKVNPSIEVAPIQLGLLNRGQRVKKKLIVRSSSPFAIRGVSSTDSRIQFAPPIGEKKLHILEYTLDTSQPGQVEDQITIFTNDPSGQSQTKIPFSAQIVPATIVENSKK
ncbi:MAG: DUF1573 domain-containing protein [Mariniblastus sp.]